MDTDSSTLPGTSSCSTQVASRSDSPKSGAWRCLDSRAPVSKCAMNPTIQGAHPAMSGRSRNLCRTRPEPEEYSHHLWITVTVLGNEACDGFNTQGYLASRGFAKCRGRKSSGATRQEPDRRHSLSSKLNTKAMLKKEAPAFQSWRRSPEALPSGEADRRNKGGKEGAESEPCRPGSR